MRIILCLIVLALDVGFCLTSAHRVMIPGLDASAAGAPLAIWAGVAGLVFLMALTWLVSLFAFAKKAA